MYSDFHNDFLTHERAWKLLKEYERKRYSVVGAVFRGNRSFETIKGIAEKFMGLKPRSCDFAFEDIGFDSFENVVSLIELRPLYVTLTWNGENSLGYGCSHNEKLKEKGLKAIEILNEYGVAVDTAHICEKGFCDVLEKADKVINSHTCFTSVCEHKRNLKTEQIKALVEKKGIVGLALYSPFVCGKEKADVYDVFRQIDFFCERFSYENLVLGTDFYGADSFPAGLNDYDGINNLVVLMREQGYPEKVVKAIICENLKRFITQTRNGQGK